MKYSNEISFNLLDIKLILKSSIILDSYFNILEIGEEFSTLINIDFKNQGFFEQFKPVNLKPEQIIFSLKEN